jgi:hypothetical protein
MKNDSSALVEAQFSLAPFRIASMAFVTSVLRLTAAALQTTGISTIPKPRNSRNGFAFIIEKS